MPKPQTKQYLVLSTVVYDHVRYVAGDTIELEDRHAASLLDVEAIAEIDADAEGAEARTRLLTAAIAKLDPDDAEHFTRGGLPQVDALAAASALAGVTAAERDAAWVAYQRRGAETG